MRVTPASETCLLGGLGLHHDKKRGTHVSRVINDLAPVATTSNIPAAPAKPGAQSPAGKTLTNTGNRPFVSAPAAPASVPLTAKAATVAPNVNVNP